MDDFASKHADGTWLEPLSAPDGHSTDVPETAISDAAIPDVVHPPLHIGGANERAVVRPVADAVETEQDDPGAPPEPLVVFGARRLHPLDRPDDAYALERSSDGEATRIRLAWAKLLWLLSFLAVLLAISYLVPYIAEETQYAITRGRQRAEHEHAVKYLPGSPLAQLSQAYQMVSQAVGPSVVHINTQGGGTDLFARPMMGPLPRIPTDGQGSGCIIDVAGYILTNYHVIRDAGQITVSLADGRKVPGEIVGFDRETDPQC
jgi:hypothetical protein